MIIGDYTYEGRGVFKRIIREVNESDDYNKDSPLLENQEDIDNWLNWKMEDKFWQMVW